MATQKPKFLVEIVETIDNIKTTYTKTVTAPSKSTAVRQTIRSLIATGELKKPPKSKDGWWEDVTCKLL